MVRNNPLASIQTLSQLAYHMFKDDSHYTIILGKNKSAKTTTAFNLMEKASLDARIGFKGFGANVKGIRDCPFECDYITDLETLIEILEATDDKYCFFFDEMGLSMPKRKFMARLNIAFLQELQIQRKRKLSVIGAAIGDSVDRELLKPYYLNSWIDKGSRYTKDKMTYYDLDVEATRAFVNLQRCQTKFKEYSVAPFYLHRIMKSTDFQTERERQIYDWAQGSSIGSLGLDPTQFRRNLRAFVLEKMKASRIGQ